MTTAFKESTFHLAMQRPRGFLDFSDLNRPVSDLPDDLLLIRRIIDRLIG